MIIRQAEPRDAETLHDFVLRLDRYRAPVRRSGISADDIRAAGFGADPLFEAFIAEDDYGSPLGAISFFRGYSGWHASPVACVHMLFVAEEDRGQGAGRALMAAVAAVALKRDWKRLELHVEDGNPATRFYEAIGMHRDTDLVYGIEDQMLARLAAQDKT